MWWNKNVTLALWKSKYSRFRLCETLVRTQGLRGSSFSFDVIITRKYAGEFHIYLEHQLSFWRKNITHIWSSAALYSKISRENPIYLLVPLLLWKNAWSNGVCKMSPFKAGSRNFATRTLIFEYFIVLLILSKSYYWHFSIRPFICTRDGLKDAESMTPYFEPLYPLKNNRLS